MAAIKHKVESSTMTECPASHMYVGQVMCITEWEGSPSLVGQHLMRTYDRFVLLERPQSTWVDGAVKRVYGLVLLKGSSLTITIGG